MSREHGFSLAALIMMVSVLAIMLTAAAPVYRQQVQRELEEELIFRGEEYVRAILKYQRRFGVYPPDIDALLETNGVRFLRRAYVDPITGEEFRLLTANPAGGIEGSIIYPSGTTPLFQGGPQMGAAGISGLGLGLPAGGGPGGREDGPGNRGGPGFPASGFQSGFGETTAFGSPDFSQSSGFESSFSGFGTGQAGPGGSGGFGSQAAGVSGGFPQPGGGGQAGPPGAFGGGGSPGLGSPGGVGAAGGFGPPGGGGQPGPLGAFGGLGQPGPGGPGGVGAGAGFGQPGAGGGQAGAFGGGGPPGPGGGPGGVGAFGGLGQSRSVGDRPPGFGPPGSFSQPGSGPGFGQDASRSGGNAPVGFGATGQGGVPQGVALSGVVGVAPVSESPSIKAYNGRTVYNEWEFFALPQASDLNPPGTSNPGSSQAPTFGQGASSPLPGTQPNPFTGQP